MFCSTGNWLCRLTPILWVAVLLALLFGVSGCSVNPVSGDQDFVLVSEEQEIAMGRKAQCEVHWSVCAARPHNWRPKRYC